MIKVYKDIIPDTNLAHTLGSATKNFADIYVETVNYTTLNPAVTETDPVVGAINGIVKADGAGNIGAASATSPIAITAGVISIANAAADGSTKGAAGFASADFSASSGIISLANTHNPLALQVFS